MINKVDIGHNLKYMTLKKKLIIKNYLLRNSYYRSFKEKNCNKTTDKALFKSSVTVSLSIC